MQRITGLDPVTERKSLREALGTFLTGVTVVTTRGADGEPRGFTANSFTSVSLDPPLIAICVATSASAFASFGTCAHFAINILSSEQRDTSSRFAAGLKNRFEGIAWDNSEENTPLLHGSLACLSCEVWSQIPAGDHLMLIGKVLSFSLSDEKRPLGFYRGGYIGMDADLTLLAARPIRSLVTGALIEHGGQLLLTRPRDVDGAAWEVPTTVSLNAKHDGAAGLIDRLRGFGADVMLDFAYSIYSDEAETTTVIYRGRTVDKTFVDGREIRGEWFDIQSLPLGDIPDPRHRVMVSRFAHEQTAESFGLYVNPSGPSDGRGRIARLSEAPKSWASPDHVWSKTRC